MKTILQNGIKHVQVIYLKRNLYLEYIKNSNNLTIKDNPTEKKRATDLNEHFSKEGVQMASEYMKRCLTPLISRKMQIKTGMRFLKSSIKSVGKNVGK